MATADSIPTPHADPEEWCPVVGYEGYYSVSNIGRVRRDAGGPGARAGLVLRPKRNAKTGYLTVSLFRGGDGCSHTVHTLVAAAFIGVRPNGWTVNHIDGDKLNNRPSNLEYVTRGDNARHAWETGLARKQPTHCPAGHAYEGTNLIVRKTGSIACRECARRFNREYYRRTHNAAPQEDRP